MPYADTETRRDSSNAYSLRKSQSVRDIARDYPGPGDLELRGACRLDLERFFRSYFPNAFALKWSPDHLRAIERLQAITLDGGLFALAMPRGSGKTTFAVRAALWALLYGHRRFVCLVGATEDHAKKLLKQFKTELSFNESLYRDFRQVCYPIVRLENNGRKAIGQLFDGEQTRIEWGADQLSFPLMPDSACDGTNVSGSTITVAGLTGALRGQTHALPDGTILRPELVILDDPQTRESAMSPSQSDARAALINGDVLGMAGPGRKIAAVMPCTVIREGDMASQFLDRKKNPEWGGQRTKMVYAFPTNEAWWDRYRQLREESLEAERGGVEATELYVRDREIADAGAIIAWPERFDPDEASGVQHAMNLMFRDRHAFFAEYQNEPLPPEGEAGIELQPEAIVEKVNRVPRSVVPVECDRVTAMIDVGQEVLFYAVAAWDAGFGGSVVDYGPFPDQKRPYFTASDAKNTLSRLFPSMGLEGRIFAGLEALTESLLGREWRRADGGGMRIERCLIDAGKWTDTVKKFCRESKWAGIVMPSHGQGVGPDNKPYSEYRKEPGGRIGHHWRIPGMVGRGAIRHVLMDVNYWKGFVHRRLAVARGDAGCLTLFGDDPARHRMFADHLAAESCYPRISEKSGRRVEMWEKKPNRENHLFDCVVGAAVAASMMGCALAEATASAAPARKKVSGFAAMRQRHGRQSPPP